PSTHLSLFLSTTPPPPKSTLFPYTTLFRSQVMANTREPILHPIPILSLRPTQMTVGTREVKEKRRRWREHKSKKKQAELLGKHIDRKSTRLNSSHVSISYAVFCLKKKKKKK